ncbi:uncharacterized protein LOC119833692 [Zerene cesonia]|uniref:uncharacterized protein LOC119833692 n=1 Tax=Zerene cesonia TaxID=33412 RepID=UPI0018E59534|nr:uncharacterized protein LOC119833692 [Zerene cesonia]
MFSRIGIFVIVLFHALSGFGDVLAVSLFNITTCEIFERGARFDPYAVVDSQWKIIYFWSDNTEINPIIFSLLSKKRLGKFRAVVEAIDPYITVEWHKATLLMEPRPGVQVLLLYAGTPGAFRGLVKMEQRQKVRPYPEPLIKFADLRIKMEGQYIGMMCCEDITAFVMTRVDEVPSTERECVIAAAKLGLEGPGGRSHIYLHNMTRTDL